jgi:hypothetical protein
MEVLRPTSVADRQKLSADAMGDTGRASLRRNDFVTSTKLEALVQDLRMCHTVLQN